MNIDQTIAKLYFLLASADGNISDTEITMGKKMIFFEKLNKASFIEEYESFKNSDRELVYRECLMELRKLTKLTQIKYMAWMSIVASSDGEISEEEWRLISRLYEEEFGLSFDAINRKQIDLWYRLSST